MSRLVRLLSVGTALHTFGRLRATRGIRSCRDKAAPAASATVAVDIPRFGLAALMPTTKRTAAVRPLPIGNAAHIRSPSVRVYRGSSGMTMVGKIDAICRMIDRAIADEGAGLTGTRPDVAPSR